eukprot:TRINITY_DN2642_c0_g2_i1.p1 TRINITY_DN2642_c0_g2~~TRINITY_DN2642_c0_g2_i1.p1  ORF type:complete len:456 (+),score=112.15 TRINITY_DN2642_c0_g2_i1:65-1432(+)
MAAGLAQSFTTGASLWDDVPANVGTILKQRVALRRAASNVSRASTTNSKGEDPKSSPLIDPEADAAGPHNIEGLKDIFCSPFSLFLLCIPAGYVSATQGWGDVWTFSLNFLALLPLAKVLGDATEELATALKNDAVAGILNATFGNFVEMMITVNSLRAGLMDVVKGTLLGSILSNMLLVLGMAFFFGGLTKSDANNKAVQITQGEKMQKFAMHGVTISMAMLLFCCMSFAFPTIFALGHKDDPGVLAVSRIGSVLVMSSYLAFLLFQLLTHRNTLERDEEAVSGTALEGGEDEESEEANLSISVSVALMMVVTIITDRVSDYLCEAIKGLIEVTGMPAQFLGVILLPIAGNACEHLGAVRFAMVDKPGLALGIAVGSSTQVALFVVPFAVIAGWIMGVPMDMNFGMVNTAVIILSVLLVALMLQDGFSHWLKGYILMLAYVFVSVLYWYLPPDE